MLAARTMTSRICHYDAIVDHPDEPTADEARPALPVALRRNRNFQLLWTGQILSDLGSEFGVIAYPLLIFAITGSPVIAGAVATVTSIVAFVVRLPAGAFADRVNRRWAMLLCDGVRMVVLAGLAVGVLLEHTGTHYQRGAHAISWQLVLLVAIIDRIGDTIFTPASIAALPRVVESAQLEGAWAATEARQYTATLAGPALGGILFSIGAAAPFIGDAVSYGASVVTSGLMTGDFDPEPSDTPRKGLWKEALDGFRFIWHDALLRAVIFQSPLINLAATGVVFTVILGLRHSGTSPAVIGVAQAAIGASGLLGAIASPRIVGRVSLSAMVVLLTGKLRRVHAPRRGPHAVTTAGHPDRGPVLPLAAGQCGPLRGDVARSTRGDARPDHERPAPGVDGARLVVAVDRRALDRPRIRQLGDGGVRRRVCHLDGARPHPEGPARRRGRGQALNQSPDARDPRPSRSPTGDPGIVALWS